MKIFKNTHSSDEQYYPEYSNTHSSDTIQNTQDIHEISIF